MEKLETKKSKERENKIFLMFQNLDLTLKSVLSLKNDLISSQQYEKASELHILELQIRKTQSDVKQYVNQNHTQ